MSFVMDLLIQFWELVNVDDLLTGHCTMGRAIAIAIAIGAVDDGKEESHR